MRDVNGVRFYEGRDVDHSRVQAAQRVVGDQLEAERLARIAVRPRLQRHEYGPHRPEDARTFEPVAVRVKWTWMHVEIDDRIVQQRAQINRLAHRSRA